MGGVCNTHETFHIFWPQNPNRTACFGYPAVNIILKWIAKTWFGRLGSGVAWQEYRSLPGFCEHDNEPSGSIKQGECVVCLNNCTYWCQNSNSPISVKIAPVSRMTALTALPRQRHCALTLYQLPINFTILCGGPTLLRRARGSETGPSADKTLVFAFGLTRTTKLTCPAQRRTGLHLEATASCVATPFVNPLTPNDPYRGRTAPLTSKVAFYIFIQQI